MSLFVKKLREGGEGEFEVIKLDPSQYTVEGLLLDVYMAKGWAEATEEEYEAQVAPEEATEAPVEAEEPVEDPIDEVAPTE